jgi:hypothetical protein
MPCPVVDDQPAPQQPDLVQLVQAHLKAQVGLLQLAEFERLVQLSLARLGAAQQGPVQLPGWTFLQGLDSPDGDVHMPGQHAN